MAKVSVIIPVYGVERFIERCARSLMEQTLQDVEFLFVDDASKDASREILERVLAGYPDRNVRILTHESNRGLPAARNTGLAEATGRYIFHCDGDDWVEPDMLERLYDTAVENDADYVWCDFFISFNRNERYMKARGYRTPDELLRKGFLAGDMKFNVWNKMVRRDVYERAGGMQLFPSDHRMAEDMTMILLAACAGRVAYVPKALYHYVKTNGGAMTQTVSERQLADIRHNVSRVEQFLKEKAPGDYDVDIALFKLNVKLPFLLAGDAEQLKLWKEWYPEANRYAMANTQLPFRTRLLEWMAAHGQFWYVRLYYSVVYRFIYGVIYK